MQKAACIGAMIIVIIIMYQAFTDHYAERMTTRARVAATPPAAYHYDPMAVGIDKSVIASHEEFAKEALDYSMGANATDTYRDDTNEVNKRWGLRRIDYESAAPDSDARTISSEDPSQMIQHKNSFVL